MILRIGSETQAQELTKTKRRFQHCKVRITKAIGQVYPGVRWGWKAMDEAGEPLFVGSNGEIFRGLEYSFEELSRVNN